MPDIVRLRYLLSRIEKSYPLEKPNFIDGVKDKSDTDVIESAVGVFVNLACNPHIINKIALCLASDESLDETIAGVLCIVAKASEWKKESD